MDIIISGSLAFDLIMNFPGYFKDHIMPDKIHVLSVAFTIDKLVEKKGGVAGNIAYTLNLLGEKSKIIAAAGKDFNNEYREYLENLGIETSGIKIIEDEPTARIRIITDKADNQISAFHPGAMNFSHQASLIDLLRNNFNAELNPPLAPPREGELLKPPPVEGVGGGFESAVKFNSKFNNQAICLIGPDGKEGMKKRAEECKELSIPYIFDPGQSMGLWSGKELQEMIKSAKILIVNDYELEVVQKKARWEMGDIFNNIEVLITTLGENGSVIYAPTTPNPSLKRRGDKRKIEIPAAKVKKTADPTGAGDAYRAGLLKGLVNGWDWEKTGRVAALCGAYAVEHYGTQEHKFSLEEFGKRFEESFGKRLKFG